MQPKTFTTTNHGDKFEVQVHYDEVAQEWAWDLEYNGVNFTSGRHVTPKKCFRTAMKALSVILD